MQNESQTTGSVRVIHINTPAEDTQGDTIVRVDRKNPVLGNRHVLKSKFDPIERSKVIEAFRADMDLDMKREGPMSVAVFNIVTDVLAGKDVALACH